MSNTSPRAATPFWTVVVVVAFALIVVAVDAASTSPVHGSQHTDSARSSAGEWRPCKTARQRYDEASMDSSDDQETRDLGNAANDNDFEGDEFAATGNEEADEKDYAEDKTKRGVRGQQQQHQYQQQPVKSAFEKVFDYRPVFEKKFNRPHPAALPIETGGNGLRVDTSLLHGETVELPTYVNVPVTLRCKFVPVDGTDNKFETVVEAMYPGHADAPLPTPAEDSHAAQIIKQLLDSMQGWRGVASKQQPPVTRSVRRVPSQDNRSMWPAAGAALQELPAFFPMRRHDRRQWLRQRFHGTDAAQDPSSVLDELAAADPPRAPIRRYYSAAEPQLAGGYGDWTDPLQPSEDQQQMPYYPDTAAETRLEDRPVELQQFEHLPAEDRVRENQLIEEQQRPYTDTDEDQQDLMEPVDDAEQQQQVDDDQQAAERVDEQIAQQAGYEGQNEDDQVTAPQVVTTQTSDYATFGGKRAPLRTHADRVVTTTSKNA